MSEPSTVIEKLVSLSQIDSKIAGVAAEKKRLEKEYVDKTTAVKRLEVLVAGKSKFSAEKQALYNKEEKRIKEERDKLIARRKALTTLNTYKLQQAAEREVDAASKHVDQAEDMLLKIVDELELATNETKQAESELAQARSALTEFESAARTQLASIEERQRKYLDEKAQVVLQIDKPSLSIYERVHERFPSDAVVPLNKDSCTGCFMSLGPQTTVQILKGDAVIKCRGCGRIVFLPKAE